MASTQMQKEDKILDPNSKLFQLISSHDERLRALIKSEVAKQHIPYTILNSNGDNSNKKAAILKIASKLPKEICYPQTDTSSDLFFALDYEKGSSIASFNDLIYSAGAKFVLNLNELENETKNTILNKLGSQNAIECHFHYTDRLKSHHYYEFSTQILNSDSNTIKELEMPPRTYNRFKESKELYLGFAEKGSYRQRNSKILENLVKISPNAIELRIKIPSEIIDAYPDLLTHKKLYLYQKIDGVDLHYNWGTIYQYEFQLYGLQSLWFKSNAQTKSLHDFLANEEKVAKKKSANNELKWETIKPRLPIHIDNKNLEWDLKQQDAFVNIFNDPCLTALNGIAGSGKTTVMNACWNALIDKKILVLAHDHKIVDSIMKKYIEVNPHVIFYRIGKSPKAREGAMAEHHYENKERNFQTQIIQNIGDNIQRLEESPQENDKKKVEILKDWQKFLDTKPGKLLFEQIKFNSARAIFCTIGGVEHYNKIGLLHEFLPFDYLFLDEASMIDLPQLFHATQFCKSRVIAGDKFLIQPMQSEDNLDLKTINALQELEKSYPKRDDIFVTFLFQYRIFDKLFKIISEELFGDWQKEKGIQLENKTKSNEMFSVNENQAYLSINPLVFVDTSLFGIQAKQIKKTNPKEIEIILSILDQLNQKQDWKNDQFKGPCKIWITSLFGSQIDKLKEEIEPEIDRNRFKNLEIEICKVRDFTGNEKEIVIWSLCVAPESFFKSNSRGKSPKVNLDSLTRADLIYDLITRSKSMLYIVGVKQIFAKISEFMQKTNASDESVFNFKKFSKMLTRILNESKQISAITRPNR